MKSPNSIIICEDGSPTCARLYESNVFLGTNKGGLLVYDRHSNRLRTKFSVHDSVLLSIGLMDNDIYTLGKDSKLKHLTLRDNGTHECHPLSAFDLNASKNQILCGSCSNSASLRCLKFNEMMELINNEQVVVGASAKKSSVAFLFNLDEWRFVAGFVRPRGDDKTPVNTIAWFKEEYDGEIQQQSGTSMFHKGKCKLTCGDYDGRALACVSSDGVLSLWNIQES
ncbi:hypothetical protein ACOME3_001545 [Neoechinorhynchus agilis]